MVVKVKEFFEETRLVINTYNCISVFYRDRTNTRIIVNMSLVFPLL